MTRLERLAVAAVLAAAVALAVEFAPSARSFIDDLLCVFLPWKCETRM